ncbi:ubiquitin-conjugating enzyme E2 L3-like [Pteronotus mesoamericanus]|uniref:ubiquitin-conjugating enzyme E2 L3-like n=1 Tax=Pteronotus mesoamericanus TaxID=1884717 RepID=UPI0023EAD505|nr:ubiquitin-conjugating enzyme E2 L3-like [Pteronotus parnellii mesoamericanus]
MKNFQNMQVNKANLLTWQGLIVSDNPPYDKGAFRIKINFPTVYPFKPPKIIFKKVKVCLPVIGAEIEKPAKKTNQVTQSLIALMNDPQPKPHLQGDLNEEYSKDHKNSVRMMKSLPRNMGKSNL